MEFSSTVDKHSAIFYNSIHLRFDLVMDDIVGGKNV